MRLLPRDESFFDEFEKHAQKTVEGCRVFVEMAQGKISAAEACPKIKTIESECDHITHHVVERLHKVFITPIDRNDIFRLISKMDDVMDFVEAASQRIALYEVDGNNVELWALARVLQSGSERISEALVGMRNLKHPDLILEKCVEINRLENEADVQLRSAIAKLFKEEKDPIRVIKWKEIFELLETATDRCEDVANIIEGVVLENSWGDVDHKLLLVIAVVAAAFIFDYINGFHDAANSIATVVSTRVLTPFQAVLWAAFFNFVAFAVFQLHVAGTIGKDIIDPSIVDISVIIGALSGAIAWNLLTWWWGLPSSSSHALVGGLIGAGVSKAGFGILGWQKISVTALFIVVSPVIGYVGSALMTVACSWLLRRMNPGRVDRWFRRLQLVSAAAFSLNHGGNDAQKTMGIIVVLLYSQGYLGDHFPTGHQIPKWIVLGCYLAMGLGTMSGGWRIVKTMGMRLTKLRPFGGFCAESGGSVAIFAATMLGIPVSTTHTITGAIVGVGSTSSPGKVRWGVAGRIVWAWIFTIPASAAISAVAYYIARALGA